MIKGGLAAKRDAAVFRPWRETRARSSFTPRFQIAPILTRLPTEALLNQR
jgi:hypothetical protein